MKRLITLAVAFMAVAILYSATAQAQVLNRVSSQFFRWDGSEDATSSGAPGITIYSHVLFNPVNSFGVPKYNVGYVQLAVTGDEHFSSTGVPTEALFGCFINGFFCNPGSGNLLGITGFVGLGKTGEDNHDNSETYHWCFPLPGGTNSIAITLASDNGGTVFVQGAYIDLEAAKLPSGSNCTVAP